MGRRACTTGLRGGEHSPAAGLKNGTGSCSRGPTGAAGSCHCNPGCFGPQHQVPATTREEKTGIERCVVRGTARQTHHGARIPKEGACKWLLHCSVPQFPLHQSEERGQVPGSAALPAPAELPSPQAGFHLSPGKGSGQQLLQPGNPRREQSFPHTGKMFTHPHGP